MGNIFQIILSVVILFFSVMIHECSHGLVALWRGDPTAKNSGRLTLNPIPHIDVFGTIMLPLFLIIMGSKFLFGWAKPVPINPYNFKNPKKDLILVSFSGPLSNFILAIIAGIILRLGFHGVFPLNQAVAYFLFFACLINLILGLFNLIPVPPLDGSKILIGLLPTRQAIAFARLEPFGMIIVLFLLMAGVFQYVLLPLARFFFLLITGTGRFI